MVRLLWVRRMYNPLPQEHRARMRTRVTMCRVARSHRQGKYANKSCSDGSIWNVRTAASNILVGHALPFREHSHELCEFKFSALVSG